MWRPKAENYYFRPPFLHLMCLSDGILLAPFVGISIYHIDRISMEYQKETGEHRCGESPLSPLSLMGCAQVIKSVRRNTGYKSPKLYKSMNCHCSTQITFACMMGLPDRSLSTQYLDGLPGCAAVVIFCPSRAYLRNLMEHRWFQKP